MKIRIDIDDNLLRRAKAEAARRGLSIDALAREGLTLAVDSRPMGRAPESRRQAKQRRILDKIVAANQRMGFYDD